MSIFTYIDLGDGYFEVSPFSIDEFQKQRVSGEMFIRYGFPEITFRNEPYEYRQNLEDRYRLYDLIVYKKYNEEIKIKLRWQYGIDWIEIEGVFYSNMCKPQDDDEHKTFKITPVVLDQYTYAIANWDNEIDILTGGNKNKCVNGDFSSWLDNYTPIGWNIPISIPSTIPELYRKFDKTYAKLADTDLFGESVAGYISPQWIPINKDSSVQIVFDYEVIHYEENTLEHQFNKARKISVQLATSLNGTYYLGEDGSWGQTPNDINYIPNGKKVVQIEYFLAMQRYSIITDQVPFEGILTIFFYSGDYNSTPNHTTYLILGDVKVYANTMIFEDITINITAAGLSGSVLHGTDNPLSAVALESDYIAGQVGTHPLYGYFVSAAPNLERLADVGLGLRDPLQYNALLTDILTVLSTDPNHALYKSEISQLTVYEGPEFLLLGGNRRGIIGTCSVTREVSYTQDVDDNPVPPPGEGWFDTSIVDVSRGRKWLRTPYNGEYNEWEHYGITDPITGTTPESGSFGGRDYHTKLQSRKTYPFANGSKTFNNGIDFKSLIRTLFTSLHPVYADKEVFSNFFWNNDEPNMPSIFYGLNYVTRQPNFLNNLTCLPTRSLKTSITDNSSDTELKLSFRGVMDDLKSYLKIYDLGGLYWWIDEGYNLHIEHAKYMDLTVLSYNITDYTNKPMKDWGCNSELIYSNISFDQINSGYKDFKLNTISFDTMKLKIAADNKRENKTKIFTTDLKYCIENPNGLANGLVLVNHDGLGVAKYAQSSPIYRISSVGGAGSGLPPLELNGNLSLANILYLFGRYEGVWIEGYINDSQVLFENIIRMIDGDEILAKAIVDGQFFGTPIDPEGGFATNITHNFNDQTTKLKLSYRTNFAIDGGVETLIDTGSYVDLIQN